MEFGEMLKEGLHETPGRGFTSRMKEQVLREVSGIRPRRATRRSRPWTVLTAVAALSVAAAAGWGAYEHKLAATSAAPPNTNVTKPSTAKPSSSPVAVTKPLAGPDHVSPTPGLGDTLDILRKQYGTPTQVTHPENPAAAVEYTFPNSMAVWLREGRVIEIQRAFSASEAHTAHQVTFGMTPADSALQGTPITAGDTQVFMYQSASLAKFMPKDWFGPAASGAYRVEFVFPASGAGYAKITLGDAYGYPLTFTPGSRPQQTTVAYQSEGMYEETSAKLWQSSQGYSMYVPSNCTASAEEPGADTVFLNMNHDFTMRIQKLPDKADPTQAVNQAKQQLSAIGNPSIGNPQEFASNDDFRYAHFVGSASHGSSNVTIWVMSVDGGSFQFTITAPKEAESLEPFYTMLDTIRVTH